MDDFYRIPKSKCYMMMTRPSIDDKTADKNCLKDNDNAIEKASSARPIVESSEIPMVKIERPTDGDVLPESARKRRKRRIAEKKRGRARRKKIRPIADEKARIIGESAAERCSEKPESDDLNDNEVDKDPTDKGDKNDAEGDKTSGEASRVNSNDESTRTRVLSEDRKKSPKRHSSSPYECQPCGYKFSRKWKYERHMNSHTRKKSEPMLLECTPCGKNFTRPSAYKQHMLKHSNEKPHKCDVCDKAFKRPYELKMHREIHSGSMHTCDICSFSTAYKVSLMVHKKRVHQKVYRHKCEQCDKAFMSKHELEDHRTCHLGTKSFICEICGNGFLQRSYLVHHKRIVHGVHNRAPMDLKCELCDKTFATKYCLQNHVGLHSQKFLCSQCGKEFASNYSLRMHNRMHTGERPHKCNMCNKSFARSNALAVHKLTHTGQRPYVCDICDKTFTQRTTMMAHRRKHPGSHPPPPRTSLVELVSAADSNP